MTGNEPQKWYRRPLLALLILTSEYLTISFGFDAQLLLERAGAWEGLGWMGLLGTGLIAFGTSLWLLASDQLRAVFARSATATFRSRSLARRLFFHGLCFAAFFATTALVFGDQEPPPGPPAFWIGLWVLGGTATTVSLVPVAVEGLRVRPLLRELAMPLAQSALLALVAWAAGLASLALWEPLGRVTLDAVAALLGTLIWPIYFEPLEAVVGTQEFSVLVAPVCSGYEGIGLIIVFLTAYLVVFRQRFRFPRVLLVAPAAILAVWLLNVLRIVALILIGHAGFEDVAVGGFHSKAGWLFFCAVALGAVWIIEHVPWFARNPATPRGTVINPSAPYLLPLLAVIGTSLVTGLFAEEIDYLYALRAVAGFLVLTWYGKDYAAEFERQRRGRSPVSWHAIGIGVVVYVLWIGLSSLDPDVSEARPEALSELAVPLTALWIVGRALGSILVIPAAEELAFRGFLLRRLISADFTRVSYSHWNWPAVIISSLAFAVAHQQWVGGFFAGVLYAYAARRRGLLSDAILAHAVTNALIAAQVLLAGHWSLW